MTSRSAGRLAAEAIAIVLLAAAAAAVSNAVAGPERRLDWRKAPPVQTQAAASPAVSGTGSAAPPASAGTASAAATPWVEVSGEEADRLLRSGVLFLDARRSSEYRAGHIAGARSMPVWEAGLEDKVKALFQERTDQSLPIVVYCNGGECEDSHELAQKLYLSGFDAVRVYRDGYPDWSRRGLPVRKGDAP